MRVASYRCSQVSTTTARCGSTCFIQLPNRILPGTSLRQMLTHGRGIEQSSYTYMEKLLCRGVDITHRLRRRAFPILLLTYVTCNSCAITMFDAPRTADGLVFGCRGDYCIHNIRNLQQQKNRGFTDRCGKNCTRYSSAALTLIPTHARGDRSWVGRIFSEHTLLCEPRSCSPDRNNKHPRTKVDDNRGVSNHAFLPQADYTSIFCLILLVNECRDTIRGGRLRS